MTTPGTLYIIAAASGTGKTSLAKALSESMANIKISVSHTTRPLRANEEENVSYFYVDEGSFVDMIEQDSFLEYAKVFDYYYGTSGVFVREQLQQGFDVILDIDWQGAQQVRQKMPECVSIFLLPPSLDVLRKRLENRKRDTQEIIEKRLVLAGNEVSHYNEFDYLVINDDFDTALQDLQAIVRTHRLQRKVQELKHTALLRELVH